MLTSVTELAKQRYLDTETAEAVALTSNNVFVIGNQHMVQTAFVENFVNEVKAAQGGEDASTKIRARLIAVQQNPFYRFETDLVDLIRNDIELPELVYEAFFDYYLSNGEMPYSVAKARDGDPYEWVNDRIRSDLGVN